MATNPYQTPQGQLESDEDFAYGEIKFFSPSSRINRLRYLAHSMLVTLGLIPLFALVSVAGAFLSGYLAMGLKTAAYIALIVFGFILMIQRLHDLNKTGWMSLLILIPFANLYLLVLLIFFKGTPGRNNYGLQTPPNKLWHWILGLSYPVIFFLGIIAAIALPAYLDFTKKAKEQNTNTEQFSLDTEYPVPQEQQPALDSPVPENNNANEQNNQNTYDQGTQQHPTEQSNYTEPAYTEPEYENDEDEPYEEPAPETQYQDEPEPDYGPVEEASTYEQATENYNDTYEEPVEEYGDKSQYEHIPSADRVITE